MNKEDERLSNDETRSFWAVIMSLFVLGSNDAGDAATTKDNDGHTPILLNILIKYYKLTRRSIKRFIIWPS